MSDSGVPSSPSSGAARHLLPQGEKGFGAPSSGAARHLLPQGEKGRLSRAMSEAERAARRRAAYAECLAELHREERVRRRRAAYAQCLAELRRLDPAGTRATEGGF